ncbi:MAG: glycosyltransferase [Aeromonadaceae bacterium]|nr:glycosyltransferase [Aeromonadaceae bacterium]
MRNDLIILGESWHKDSATKQLIEPLLSGRKVLWLEDEADMAQTHWPQGQAFANLFRLGLKQHHWRQWLGSSQWQQQARQIRQAIQDLGLQDPVLWVTRAELEPLLEELRGIKVVYFCNQAPGFGHPLVERADLILAIRPEPVALCPAHKTQLLCSQPLPLQLRPKDLPANRPLIGFCGPLDDQLDWELLQDAARWRPDWNWVLIGPKQSERLDSLLRLPNVLWLGEKTQQEYGAYLQYWHVTLLPLRECPGIASSYELTIGESLALGKPVVTRFRSQSPGYQPLLTCVSRGADLAELLPVLSLAPIHPQLGQRQGWLGEPVRPHTGSLAAQAASVAAWIQRLG